MSTPVGLHIRARDWRSALQISEFTLYRWMREGLIPRSQVVNAKYTYWDEDTVRQWWHEQTGRDDCLPLCMLRSDVLARTGFSEPELMAAIRNDGFPRPVYVCSVERWVAGDVNAWVAANIK